MKNFDLSEKELKSLLQAEGMEEPSMGFNQSVLSKIEAYERQAYKPVSTPKWLLISFLVLFTAPAIYFLATSSFDFGNWFGDVSLPAMSFDLGIGSTYTWVSAITLVSIWMAILFDRFFLRNNPSEVKNG